MSERRADAAVVVPADKAVAAVRIAAAAAAAAAAVVEGSSAPFGLVRRLLGVLHACFEPLANVPLALARHTALDGKDFAL